MNIFSKPLNEITYNDIVSFCEEDQEEGVNLDYKQDFPKDLEKSISAFANTYGGLIIIGVKDEDNRPKPPFKGIEFAEKAEERVFNKNVDNIYPPVDISVRSIPNEDKSKMFVLIRVPESHDAPHGILNKTHIYIRTGDRTKREELANFDQLEWLINKRKKSEDLRDGIIQQARTRVSNLKISGPHPAKGCELTFSFCPLYPHTPLAAFYMLRDIVFNSVIRNKNREFPSLSIPISPIKDGLLQQTYLENYGKLTYLELNTYGLLFYQEILPWDQKNEGSSLDKRIFMSSLIELIDLSFDAADKIYTKLGYNGIIQYKFDLKNILGSRFVFPSRITAFIEDIRPNPFDDEIGWTFNMSTNELADPESRCNRICDFGSEICLAFGLEFSHEQVLTYLVSTARWRK